MSPPFDLECDHFTAGAVGPPGQRVFYLQGASGPNHITLRCEKQQVAALGEYLERMLADLPPPTRPLRPVTPAELIEPVEPYWIVGGLVIGFDADNDRILLVISEAVPDDEPEGEEARWIIGRDQARAFVDRAQDLVRGRPTCRPCGRPIDPDGHTCVKTNGHHPT